MKRMAIIGLLLVMLLVLLSAYLRLDQSGIGCTPWPECYGNIGPTKSQSNLQNAYDRLVEQAREPMSWTRPLHRLVASVLGLLALGIAGMSIRAGNRRGLALSILGLTVFLAWLGIYSEGLHNPAVVLGNLGGGFAMLGLFGLLVFDKKRSKDKNAKIINNAAIAMVCLQVLLGGLTSANFAANACQTLPHCNGMWLPGSEVVAAFDLTRPVVVDDQGFVVGGDERHAIHQLHRIGALFTIGLALAAGIFAIRNNPATVNTGVFLCVVVVAETLVGIAAIMTDLPISIALAHNWLAGLLLLGLLKLRVAGLASHERGTTHIFSK